MKRFVLCLAALLLVPGLAMAQPFDGAANSNLIMTNPSYTACDPALVQGVEDGSCTSLVANQVGVPGQSFMWVVVSRSGGFPSIGGAQFGVTHNGVLGWSLCTGGNGIGSTDWPNSGEGMAATWGGGCFTPGGSNALVGYLTVGDGSAVSAQVVQDPRTSTALWADCGNPPDVPPTEFEICPENLGGLDTAGTSNLVCDDNCGSVPTQEASWGQIKSLF